MSLRFGVLGAGWVATSRHLPNLARLPGVEVVGVYDHDLDNAASAAPSGALATDDIDELLSLNLDAVTICSPPWVHCDHTIAALERRCHVLCEKPMAMNSAEAKAMVAAAADANRILCVSHNFLWSRSFEQAKRKLESSGDVLYVSATQLSSDERRLPSWSDRLEGGLLFDEIPHMLYVVEDLVGAPLEVETVRAIWGARTSEPQSCEVSLRGSLAGAQLTIVFGAPVSEWHVTTVAGSTVIDVDLFRDVMVSSGSDRAHTAGWVLATSARVAARHFSGFAASGFRQLRGRQHWGHDGLIADFVSAVTVAQSGGPVVSPVPIERALSVVRCADDIIGALGRG